MKQSLKNKAAKIWKVTKQILFWSVVVIAICSFIYFMYWITKAGSYTFFYEDMVQDTIREMVKAGSLK